MKRNRKELEMKNMKKIIRKIFVIALMPTNDCYGQRIMVTV